MARSLSIALLASAVIPAALAATTGSFSAVTFNVAGLPEILQNNDVPGDKTENTATIGTKFSDYGFDIIHVQEDFNYHATLYEYDNHTYRTATSGGVPFGSGLNTLSNYDWIDFTRVEWDDCSNASGADCLTPKGFTFMRMKIDQGVWIDVYNLHTDAGYGSCLSFSPSTFSKHTQQCTFQTPHTSISSSSPLTHPSTEDADQTARQSNIQQVADHIDTYSTGNAVLVFGDTNSRYTRTLDNIRLFSTQSSLTDAWVQIIHAGTPPSVESLCDNPSTTPSCETVDKLFYRGSPAVNLTATAFEYASSMFLQSNGSILSDHNPIHIDLAWSVEDVALRQSDFFGGPHGTWFSDVPALDALDAASPAGATVTLRGAERVDGVGIALAGGATNFTHGGTGGEAVVLELGEGEYVDSVRVCEGKYNDETRIFYVQVSASAAGKSVEVGVETEDCATFEAPAEGWGLVGFVGQDGDEIDQVAVVWGEA